MSIKKEQVLTALTHVLHPDKGADLVSLDMIHPRDVNNIGIIFNVEQSDEGALSLTEGK